jgi:hypothetical protein
MANAITDIQDELHDISHRSYLLLSITFFLGFVVFVIFILTPDFNAIFSNREQLGIEQDKLEQLSQKFDEIKNLLANHEFSTYGSLVNNILYVESPFIAILYTLNEVAANYQIDLSRMTYSPGLTATPSAEFAARQSAQTAAARYATARTNDMFVVFIEASGTYANLVAFLHELESYAPFNSIAYSEITNNLLGQAKAQLEIIIQYYTPKATVDINQPLPVLSSDQEQVITTLRDYTIPDFSNLDQQDIINDDRLDIFNLDPSTLPQLDLPTDETNTDLDSN